MHTTSSNQPSAHPGQDGCVVLAGDWTVAHGADLEAQVDEARRWGGHGAVALDLSNIKRFDTVGALILSRIEGVLQESGARVSFQGARQEQQTLLDALREGEGEREPPPEKPEHSVPFTLLADVGESVLTLTNDFEEGVAYLGATVAALIRVATHPQRFRLTSFVHHLEQVAFRAVPIIMLISFLVGAIVAQQSIFQLRTFGADIFVVDLIGILSLRELGVLLTAIMMAGRSGSAFTAEIGSMKMREEIDALRVMGLDPVEVLVLPRLLALVAGLPLLTFLAEIAALGGGGAVAWVYGNISPDVFLDRLQTTLTMSSFEVGLIKAPFMGLVVALIATIEGLRVEGSAESLGKRTTSSVVKSIFMVIVLDGFFAMFFASMGM